MHTPSFESCRNGDLKLFIVHQSPRVSGSRKATVLGVGLSEHFLKGLILAQNERWRRGLGMQVERETLGNWGGKWRKGQ